MNAHDKIELPPLPEARIVSYQTDSTMRSMELRTYSDQDMQEYARTAIEADHKRRGEPVAWLYEDELPDNYPYDTMFPYSKVDGVRMFPVYAPQPAEPVVKESLTVAEPVAWTVFADNGNIRIWCADPIQAETLKQQYGDRLKPLYATPQPAEPVKGPSDTKEALWEAYESLRELEKQIVLDVNQISGSAAASFAANRVLALLTKYGNPSKSTPEIDTSAQRVDAPDDWQDFPK